MLLTFDEVAQSPIEVECRWTDGEAEKFSLPKLRMRDYAGWVAEETQARRLRSTRAIPTNMPPLDRFRAMRTIENDFATFDDLWRLVQTPDGAERILKLSMARAAIPDDKQARILDTVPAAVQYELAMDLSTLFKRDPNPPATPPGGQQPDTGQQQKASGPSPLSSPAGDAAGSLDTAAAVTGLQT